MREEGICGGGGWMITATTKKCDFLLICCSMLCVMHKNKDNNIFLHLHSAYGTKIKSTQKKYKCFFAGYQKPAKLGTSFHFRKVIGENN
jgi:hypothetical protein